MRGREWMNDQGESCMCKLGHSWWQKHHDLNWIAKWEKGEQKKEIMDNRETSDQEGSSTHHYRGDLTSRNIMLIIGEMLRHSNSWIS